MEENCEKSSPAIGRVRHDIIGSLPLELVVLVVEYLDLADIVRFQRVSKRWRSIFSSNTIAKSLLPRMLAALGMEGRRIINANAMTYIRWFLRLESARPVEKVFLPWSESPARAQEILYHSRRLCYVMRGRDQEVAMLDFETGKRSIWSNRRNGDIRTIKLFDRYLFVISWNLTITAWDLHTSEKLGEQEFPWIPIHITVANDKAVIVPWVVRRSHPIYVWDLTLDQVHEFGLFADDLWMWHADADDNVLVTFEFNFNVHPPAVRETKWVLTGGELLDSKRFPLTLGGRRVEKTIICRQIDQWCHTYGDKTTTQLYNIEDKNFLMHLTFDYATDRLSVRWIDCVEPIGVVSIWGRYSSPAPHIIYRWAPQQLRGFMVYNAATGITTVRPYQADVRELSAHKLFGAVSRHARFMQPDPQNTFPLKCCGDREVYFVASDEGLQLWFFNPDFVPNLPDAEPFLAMEESG